MTSLTSWRAACDISARSFGLPTIYERPIAPFESFVSQHDNALNISDRFDLCVLKLAILCDDLNNIN